MAFALGALEVTLAKQEGRLEDSRDRRTVLDTEALESAKLAREDLLRR